MSDRKSPEEERDNRINNSTAFDLTHALGVQVSSGEVTENMYQYLTEYVESLNWNSADFMVRTFKIVRGTRNERSKPTDGIIEGLAMDVIGFIIRDENSVYVMSIINAVNETSDVLGKTPLKMPEGIPVEVTRYFSEIYDGVYANILQNVLTEAYGTGDGILSMPSSNGVVVWEPVVAHHYSEDSTDYLKTLMKRIIGVAVNGLVNLKPDNERRGIKGMVTDTGTPLFSDKQQGVVPLFLNLSKTANAGKTSENGIFIDPDTTLTVSQAGKKYQPQAGGSLNQMDKSDVISTMGITAGVALLGPEDPGATYTQEPKYRSFAVQLIGDVIDDQGIPSVGKTILNLVGSLELTKPELQKQLFSPESLAALDSFIGLNGAGKDLITPEAMVQDYNNIFPMMFRDTPLISLRVLSGTVSSMTDNLFNTSSDVINKAMVDFFQPAYGTEEATREALAELLAPQNPPVLKTEVSFTGTHIDAENNTRSLSEIDTLYVLNVLKNDPDQINRWLLAVSGTVPPEVARVYKETIIKDITLGRYEINDIATIVTFNPNWIAALTRLLMKFFSFESNAHTHTAMFQTHTPYLADMAQYAAAGQYVTPGSQGAVNGWTPYWHHQQQGGVGYY